jgi:16S rRNA (cytidine1402-2'-O)-methyltransferase
LTHYDITTPLTSYYDHIEAEKAPALIAQLRQGKTIALVSDAGTPGIADPGYRLVKGAAEAGLSVIPIPGPSTVAVLLSVGGLPTDRFVFEGFLPAKPTQRRKILQDLKQEKRTLIFFESPHRLSDTLKDIEDILGSRPMVIGRELTKIHEEVLRGFTSELRAQLQTRAIKGEVALLVGGAMETASDDTQPPLADDIRYLRHQGLTLKEIAHILGERRGVSKREVYAVGVQLQEQEKE